VDATMVSNMPGALVGAPDDADNIGTSQPVNEMASIPNSATTTLFAFASPTLHHMLSLALGQSSTERGF
jgi:hypothetical protein